MNVVKMVDGWWKMADVIPLRRKMAEGWGLKAEFISLQVPDQVSYNDAPRFLPILRSRYRENYVAYRSDTHYGVGDLSNRVIHELPLALYKTYSWSQI